MPSIQVILPAGALGAWDGDTELDTLLRDLGVAASEDPKGEWAEKYGTVFENDVFMMHRFCWCERDECAWCSPPEDEQPEANFWHKASGLKVWWYKYIGRSVETNMELTPELLAQVRAECVASLSGPDTPAQRRKR